MGSLLLLAMNVPSLFADLAMSMKEEKAINHAHNVKPDTRELKVTIYHYSISVLILVLSGYCLLVRGSLKRNCIIA